MASSVPTQRLTNWAGNHVYAAARLHEPTSVEELQQLVRTSRSLRALGSGHSFNDVADTTGDLVSLRRLPRILEVDGEGMTVTVDGGVHYGELCAPLDTAGFALHNLASLPHISVAGACATATHGSGDHLGNLATAVTAIELLKADGELAVFSRVDHPETFDGLVVALGGLGVVTKLTLEIQPTFEMRQDLYEDLPLATAVSQFDELTAAADSVSLFTEWRADTIEQVWLKRRVEANDMLEPTPALFAATRATVPMHPIKRMPADACTEQLGVPGPWFERMPHFRSDHTPSSGDELQTEYLIPRHHAADALLALNAIRARFAPLVLISEIRTVAADTLWLSTAYGRESVALHFTWVPDWEAVRLVLPFLEAALEPFEPRPHWGKVCTMPPETLRAAYDRLPDFLELRERLDPDGKFRGPFIRRNLPGR
jgi:alditol oxidase